jgi:hypothetical protein
MDQTALVALVAGILGFAAKEGWGMIQGSKKKRDEDLDKALEKNTDEILKLTVAIVELKAEFRALSEKLLAIPKLQQDMNAAHLKIREIETEKKNREH